MNRRQLKIMLLLTLVVLCTGCDLSTKWLASRHLQYSLPIPIIDNWLELRYTENEAIAFSLFHSMPAGIRSWIIYSLSTMAFIFLIILIWESRRNSIWWLVALMLVLSGALGNLSERILRGYVIDFIHFHYYDRFSWPVFNMADIFISTGGIVLAILMLRKSRNQPEATAHEVLP
jgi:signal peptidase II